MENSIVNLESIERDLKKAFKGTKAVKVRTFIDNGRISVQVIHYQTTICDVSEDGEITLDNGGYETRTTKHHLNLCLETLGKSERITQKDFTWYIDKHWKFEGNNKLTTY